VSPCAAEGCKAAQPTRGRVVSRARTTTKSQRLSVSSGLRLARNTRKIGTNRQTETINPAICVQTVTPCDMLITIPSKAERQGALPQSGQKIRPEIGRLIISALSLV
jgi:hypothetical protein